MLLAAPLSSIQRPPVLRAPLGARAHQRRTPGNEGGMPRGPIVATPGLSLLRPVRHGRRLGAKGAGELLARRSKSPHLVKLEKTQSQGPQSRGTQMTTSRMKDQVKKRPRHLRLYLRLGPAAEDEDAVEVEAVAGVEAVAAGVRPGRPPEEVISLGSKPED
jgi:hypothetical protein